MIIVCVNTVRVKKQVARNKEQVSVSDNWNRCPVTGKSSAIKGFNLGFKPAGRHGTQGTVYEVSSFILYIHLRQ